MDLQITSDVVAPPLDCTISDAKWQALVSLLKSVFPDDLTLYNLGSATPPPANRGRPWQRTDADGNEAGTWIYNGGFWTLKHPLAEGIISLYDGDEATIKTFDGGDGGLPSDVTATTGPMWVKMSELNAKFPMGAGTLPSTTVVAVRSTGGEEKHVLLSAEIPKHSHKLVNTGVETTDTPVSSLTADNYLEKELVTGASGLAYLLQGNGTAPTLGNTSDVGGDGSGNTTAHGTIPPFYAVFFIKRTGRTHYTLPG